MMRPEFGEIAASRMQLWQAVARLLPQVQRRRAMSEAVRAYAASHDFSRTAQRLAELLTTMGES
jgi:hypothetical protein